MSKINQIQLALQEIDATKFHKLVDTYLNKKYEYMLYSTGTKMGEDKPRKYLKFISSIEIKVFT